MPSNIDWNGPNSEENNLVAAAAFPTGVWTPATLVAVTAAAGERNSRGVGRGGGTGVGTVAAGAGVAGRAVTGTLVATPGRLTAGVAGGLTGVAMAGAIAADATGAVDAVGAVGTVGTETATVRRGPAVLASVFGRFPAVAAATGAVPCAERD
jgi:hypothetical protein